MYAIVDVETSGMSSTNCKITDIAIILHDGEKIVDEYQSLVNPECKISRKITQLTGIDNEMVRHAPKFYEIAKKVFQMTEDKVFVAHNVSFDYRIIRKEFEQLGGTFVRKQLCTVRTARRLLPGSKSYSLGRLCEDLAIPITQRHRAYGDALATSTLFDLLLSKSKQTGMSLWPPAKTKRKAALPPLLSHGVYDNLPTQTGIYYFHDKEGKVIYVGKANNIKQRVTSHFHDKGRKEMRLCENTANVTFEITGSELIALLLESAEIKRLMPQFNHSQKRLSETYALFSYENQQGITELRVGRLGKVVDPLLTFYTQGQADRFMRDFVGGHKLCERYTGIEKTKTACFGSRIQQCNGVCCGKEPTDAYNTRLSLALTSLEINTKERILIDNGRHADENGIIHIDTLGYQGFGFIPIDETIDNFEDFLPFIKSKEDNSDTQRIIRNALIHKNFRVVEKD